MTKPEKSWNFQTSYGNIMHNLKYENSNHAATVQLPHAYSLTNGQLHILPCHQEFMYAF